MNIGAALLPLVTGIIDLGSTTLTFGDIYIKGSGSNSHKITGTTPTAARVFNLPDASSNSVIPDTGATNNFITGISSGGVISKAQPGSSNLSDSTNIALRNNSNSWSSSQIPDAMGTRDLGSTSFAWNNIYFAGSGSSYHRWTGTTPTGARVHTTPDANSNTVQPATGSAGQAVSGISSAGVLAFTSFFAVPTVPSAKTANFNASVGNTYRVDLSGGAFTATLDTAASVAGQRIRIKVTAVGGGQLTIATTSSQTIDDGSTTSFTTTAVSVGDGWEFESDGTNWMIWG